MGEANRFHEMPAERRRQLVFFLRGARNKESEFSDARCFMGVKSRFLAVLRTKCPIDNLFAEKVLM